MRSCLAKQHVGHILAHNLTITSGEALMLSYLRFCGYILARILRVAIILPLLSNAFAATPSNHVFKFTYTDYPKERPLDGFSKNFYLPQGGETTGTKVFIWNDLLKAYADDSVNWNVDIKPLPGGAPSNFKVQFDRLPGAGPVLPGARIKYGVALNTSDVGYTGLDFKNPPDKPKRALSIDQVKGVVGQGITAENSAPNYLINATLDSAVYAGGVSGLFLSGLGVYVPAGQFAYLYQVNNLSGIDPIKKFRILGGAVLTNLNYLQYSHDFDGIDIYNSPSIEAPEEQDQFITNFPYFENLGSKGVDPLRWETIGNSSVASFSGITYGQSSGILIGYSEFSPEMGLVQVSTDTTYIDNWLYVPGVPEPGSLSLTIVGLLLIYVITVNCKYRARLHLNRPLKYQPPAT